MVDVSCKVQKQSVDDDNLSELLLTLKYVSQGENDIEDFEVKVTPEN